MEAEYATENEHRAPRRNRGAKEACVAGSLRDGLGAALLSGRISAGGRFCLAIRADRTVMAWGENESGQTDVPRGLIDVTAVAAGFAASYALRCDGTVAAWGAGARGQTRVPAGLKEVVAISAGGGHGLALKLDGTVAAWGQIGNGPADPPLGLEGVTAVASGWEYALALKGDGTVVSWGGEDERGSRPPAGLSDVAAIAVGGSISPRCLALRADGTVVTWGGGGPYEVPKGLTGVAGIAVGEAHCLALREDGTVVSWASAGMSDYYVVPSGLRGIVAIAAGGWHSLALTGDGSIVAWGKNQYGQCDVPAAEHATSLHPEQDPNPVIAWGPGSAYGTHSELSLLRGDRLTPSNNSAPDEPTIATLIRVYQGAVDRDEYNAQARDLLGTLWMNLAALWIEAGEPQKALGALSKAEEHLGRISDLFGGRPIGRADIRLAGVLYNASLVNLRLGRYEKCSALLTHAEDRLGLVVDSADRATPSYMILAPALDRLRKLSQEALNTQNGPSGSGSDWTPLSGGDGGALQPTFQSFVERRLEEQPKPQGNDPIQARYWVGAGEVMLDILLAGATPLASDGVLRKIAHDVAAGDNVAGRAQELLNVWATKKATDDKTSMSDQVTDQEASVVIRAYRALILMYTAAADADRLSTLDAVLTVRTGHGHRLATTLKAMLDSALKDLARARQQAAERRVPPADPTAR